MDDTYTPKSVTLARIAYLPLPHLSRQLCCSWHMANYEWLRIKIKERREVKRMINVLFPCIQCLMALQRIKTLQQTNKQLD